MLHSDPCSISRKYRSLLLPDYPYSFCTYIRVAQAGRNWEGFGGDPFLSGEAPYETILGMQQGGVQACAKHFIDKYVMDIISIVCKRPDANTASKSTSE